MMTILIRNLLLSLNHSRTNARLIIIDAADLRPQFSTKKELPKDLFTENEI